MRLVSGNQERSALVKREIETLNRVLNEPESLMLLEGEL